MMRWTVAWFGLGFLAQPSAAIKREGEAGVAKKPDFGWDTKFALTEVCCAPSPLPRSGLVLPHKFLMIRGFSREY